MVDFIDKIDYKNLSKEDRELLNSLEKLDGFPKRNIVAAYNYIVSINKIASADDNVVILGLRFDKEDKAVTVAVSLDTIVDDERNVIPEEIVKYTFLSWSDTLRCDMISIASMGLPKVLIRKILDADFAYRQTISTYDPKVSN